jgi:hypothetical protein
MDFQIRPYLSKSGQVQLDTWGISVLVLAELLLEQL